MKTIAMRILTGLLFCTLTACATEPAHISLKPELSQRINSSNGVILAVQNEIVADIDKSQVAMATGGGLLPMIIDASRNHSRANAAQGAVRPIWDALVDYRHGEGVRSHSHCIRQATHRPRIIMRDVSHNNGLQRTPPCGAAEPEQKDLQLRYFQRRGITE